MPRRKIPLAWGEGLDRERGLMTVSPSTFFDLRNVLLHEGKLIVRPGFSGVGEFDEVDRIVGGTALRGSKIGVVVGYSTSSQRVYTYLVSPNGQQSDLIGEWEHDQGGWGSALPRIITAEVRGQVFMAHDQELVARRAATLVYNPNQAPTLSFLSKDFTGGESAGESAAESDTGDRIRFRGVVRHLQYLFGWGWGSADETRPELIRNSLAGQPTQFEDRAYFFPGDRGDPVIACAPAGNVLLAFKRTETYAIIGYSPRNFGANLVDPRYGLVSSRAWVNVGGQTIAWSDEGPRVWGGAGPSNGIEIPLGLREWEPTDLVAEGDQLDAWGLYVPDERVALFRFGRRLYALTARVQGGWRWSWSELGFDAYCGFTLFAGVEPAVAPPGYPTYLPADGSRGEPATEPAGTYADIGVKHTNQDGDETLEIWMAEFVEAGAGEYSESVIGGAPSAYLRMDTDATTVPDASGNGRPGASVVASATDEGLFPGSLTSRVFDGDSDKRVIVARDLGDDWMDADGYYVECWVEATAAVDQAQAIVGLDFAWLRTLSDGTVQLVQRWDGAGSGFNVRTLQNPAGGNLVLAPGERWFIGFWVNNNGDPAPTPGNWIEVGGGGVSGTSTGPGGTTAKPYVDQDFIVGGGGEFTDPPPLESMLVDEVAVWAGIAAAAAEDLFDAHWAARTGVEVAEADLEWFLARSITVSPGSTQQVRVSELDSGKTYLVALRYRRGLEYNAGAEDGDDPTTWPSISQGELTTTADPPAINSATWSRTASDAERITLEIAPEAGLEDLAIQVFRRQGVAGDWTEIDEIAGTHAATFEYVDDTISGELIYQYAVSTADGALSALTQVWSGPAATPSYSYDAAAGAGYLVGFSTTDGELETELHDRYDDNGGIEAFSLRATAAATETEVESGVLSNIPSPDLTFAAKLRHKETKFTVDDYGQFGNEFNVTVPESE